MKKLTSLLLIVSLCFITLFSCGGNGSNASVDGSETTEKLAKKDNSSVKPSKEELKDRMNKANQIKNPLSVAEQLVEAKTNQKLKRMGEDQAKQSSVEQKRRLDAAKNLPTTAQQKEVADDICNCLNENPLFSTVKKSTSAKSLIASLGNDKDKDVRAMQDCYNNKMVFAVRNLGDDAGVFSKKSREHLNKTCLKGKSDFFVNIGAYLTRNRITVNPKDLPENQ